MIYTSYFAKMKKFPDNLVPVCICAKPPEWYKGLHYRDLAPSLDILMEYKRIHDTKRYERRFYNEILDHLDQIEVLFDLVGLISIDKDVVLVCFEKPDDFCHRHLVADWFHIRGVKCEEWSECTYEETNK